MPFPFVEAPRLRDRPALVIGTGTIAGAAALLWVVMMTSAENGGWPDDVGLGDRHGECGLAVPCVIRTTKISTVEAKRARKVGALPPDLLEQVRQAVSRHLGW